ncbi:hypothetical protein BL470_005058 [Escherichia coli]|nr:hypothetical protein [Escherichia coli]EFG8199857.1 hypothetical protein [Escherichia coli]EFG9152746.1 hypothetical protein [Escherichia coli]EFG9940977.1 hypothetical protein [Escherichia coli]
MAMFAVSLYVYENVKKLVTQASGLAMGPLPSLWGGLRGTAMPQFFRSAGL